MGNKQIESKKLSESQDFDGLDSKQSEITQAFEMFEVIKPEYNMVVPDTVLYRYNRGGDRYYYTDPESPDGMISYTTLAGYEVGESYMRQLSKWRATVGEEAAQYIMNSTASQGTGEHILIGMVCRGEVGSFQEVKEFGYEHAVMSGYQHLASEWMDYYCESVASWLAFMKENEVEVLAIEFPLYDLDWGIAGLVDIVADMNFNRKKRRVIIDLKRNARSGGVKYAFQLQAQKEVWNKKYPDTPPIEMIFNWSGKNWSATKKRVPTYDLVNQTTNKFSTTMAQRLSYIREEGIIKPPTLHLTFNGTFDVNNLKDVNLDDICK